jgi:GTP pyrophosphokinase
MVPIDYTLQNGNIIEIITSSNSSGPSIDWLKIAKSSNARSKIKAYLKKENKTGSIEKGKEALDRYIRKKGYDTQQILKNTYITKAAKSLKFSSTDELFNQLSQGGSLLGKIAVILVSYYHDEKQEELKKTENDVSGIVTEKKKTQRYKGQHTGVTVKGVDNLLIRFSKCCNPVPGDGIIGFITKGRGISVHRKDCANVLSLSDIERQRFIEVAWDEEKLDKSYNADIAILAEDRKGLFSDLSRVCEDMDVHIAGVNAKSAKDQFVNITMTLSISNTSQMEKVLKTLKSVQGVVYVHRAII